jgi:hypothetical protein
LFYWGCFLKRPFILAGLLICASFLSTCTPNENINFLNKISVTPVNDGVFKLNSRLVVEVDNKLITIPKGFITDFASIPKIFWSIQSPYDIKTIGPSILHDYLYTCPNNLTRQKIDSIFHSSLIDNLVNPVKSYLYWLAVRIAGSGHFNKDNHCAIASKEYNQKVSP